ncbi:MAG: outer membrane beta-barrel protein [Cyclobacteriaceae bacterium]|nr:outer membrane beta-barrel protein [Cyclobacteriaceae bacterium]UYN85575.1 MAG: outer membrane beta-barrel protein [Cyclobacteriaceae bacterium]
MRILRLLLVVALFLPEWAGAQSFYAVRRERSIIGSVGIGTATYYGELANPGDYLDAKPAVNIGMQYFLNNRISVRSDLTWFQIEGSDAKADDASRVRRNLSFKASNIELNAMGSINLAPHGQRYYQRPRLNFYAMAGIGMLYSNPTAEYQGKKYALQPLQTEGVKYSRFNFVMPYGLGTRIMLNPFTNLVFEGIMRTTFTDYLDDVSTVHLGSAAFTDPIAGALSDRRPELGLSEVAPGTQRGNPDKNDSYMILQAKLEFYIPDDVFWNSNNKLYRSKRKAYYKRRR